MFARLTCPRPRLLRCSNLSFCSHETGNLGSLMIIVVPAVCNEDRSPFGDPVICRNRGLSYAAFSMAVSRSTLTGPAISASVSRQEMLVDRL